MNIKRNLLVITAALTLGTSSVVAGEIYRYTDADGNVHYGDRPSGDPSEKRLAIASQSTDRGAVQARVQARSDARVAKQETDAEKPGAPTRSERRATRAEKEQECQSARDQLESLVTAHRFYNEDESGERVYLDDAEIQKARDKANELVEERCN